MSSSSSNKLSKSAVIGTRSFMLVKLVLTEGEKWGGGDGNGTDCLGPLKLNAWFSFFGVHADLLEVRRFEGLPGPVGCGDSVTAAGLTIQFSEAECLAEVLLLVAVGETTSSSKSMIEMGCRFCTVLFLRPRCLPTRFGCASCGSCFIFLIGSFSSTGETKSILRLMFLYTRKKMV